MPKRVPGRTVGALLAAGLACTIMGTGMAVQAQVLDQFISPNIPGFATEPGVTVTSRVRPEYASLGVRVGDLNLILRPEVLESVGYNTNVTGTRRAGGSSLIETSAALRLESDSPPDKRPDPDVSRNSLTAALTVDDIRYFDQPKQSLTNWTASLGGAYGIGRDTLYASYRHLNLNQTPRDLDVPLLDQALAYRIDSASLSYRTVFSQLFVQPGVDVSSYDYDNGTVGGTTYLQTYRNRLVVTPNVTVGYELLPRRNLLLVVRNASGLYRDRPQGMATRDYNDTAVLAGADYDLTGLLRVRLLAGYEVRSFTSNQYRLIQAPVAELSAIWNPTTLVTLGGTVTRKIQDSSDETTVGVTETALRVTADYEYLRNVVFRAQAGFFLDEYSRNHGQQTLVTAGVGATWLLDKNVRLGATYDFTVRGSTGTGSLGTGQTQRFGSGFTENRFLLQVRFAL